MKLGTVVYENQIYNLDYMTLEELKELLTKIEISKSEGFKTAKKVIENKE